MDSLSHFLAICVRETFCCSIGSWPSSERQSTTSALAFTMTGDPVLSKKEALPKVYEIV